MALQDISTMENIVERILEEAKKKAKEIIEEARKRADEIRNRKVDTRVFEQEAEKIIEQAMEEAEKILERSRKEADEIRLKAESKIDKVSKKIAEIIVRAKVA